MSGKSNGVLKTAAVISVIVVTLGLIATLVRGAWGWQGDSTTGISDNRAHLGKLDVSVGNNKERVTRLETQQDEVAKTLGTVKESIVKIESAQTSQKERLDEVGKALLRIDGKLDKALEK